jgi:hypothetical protein
MEARIAGGDHFEDLVCIQIVAKAFGSSLVENEIEIEI